MIDLVRLEAGESQIYVEVVQLEHLGRKPGEGSTFRFTARFQRVDSAQPVPAVKQPVVMRGLGLDSEAKNQLGSLSILVAEDNFSNLKLATRLLESWGQRVTIAVDGREALRLVEQQSFDLILMDIQMPDVDGIEVASVVRKAEEKTGKHTPIVALTAHAWHNIARSVEPSGWMIF